MRNFLENIPQVAVLLPAAVKVSRDMRRGLLNYIHQHGPWSLHIIDGRIGGQDLSRPQEWGCSGLIGRLFKPEQARQARRLRVPMVLVDANDKQSRDRALYAAASLIRCDTEAVGRFAAEYFLGKHYMHFAYVNELHRPVWSVLRGEAFRKRVTRAGFDCSVFTPPPASEQSPDSGAARRQLARWLKRLPKPVALYAATDARGRQVFDVAHSAGISIPTDIAILGTDNDEDLCETTVPPMSSILLDAGRAAYDAAALLEAAMRSGKARRRIIKYGPSRVVERDSTVGFRLKDSFVSRALEFIALNACSGIGVADIARRLNVSRRFLEGRFRSALGRTILDEIQRARLERVSVLLRETTMPVSAIVVASGFTTQSYLGTLFEKRFGCTMRDWRAQRINKGEQR